MMLLISFCYLSACTPFIEYEHLSRPNVSNDGYDLLCAGMEGADKPITVSAALCQDMWRSIESGRGTFFKGSVRYGFGQR